MLAALIMILPSLLGFIALFRRRRSLNVPLPPSPPSDFILGHLRRILSENPEIKYAEWAKTYGDVIYLRILNRDVIVLSSAKAATDLLEKRGENHSQRPKNVIFDLQAKAREELDLILQCSRLPEFNDRQSLLYIECVVQETFRWLSVLPLATPHGALKDDIYNNMFIPEGSIVLANLWAILRDERVYRETDIFNPSRYLPVSKGGNGEPFADSHFGYGRRICPGRHFADNSVWITVATVLTLFEIQRVKDESGNDIIPPVAFATGLVSHPKPYECKIELRGQWAKTLLDEVEFELSCSD